MIRAFERRADDIAVHVFQRETAVERQDDVVALDPAYGFGMNAQGGDYLLTTGQMQPSQELLYVIDAASEKMLVYRFDLNRKQIRMGRVVNLAKMRQSAAKDSGSSSKDRSGSKGRRGRGRGRG